MKASSGPRPSSVSPDWPTGGLTRAEWSFCCSATSPEATPQTLTPPPPSVRMRCDKFSGRREPLFSFCLYSRRGRVCVYQICSEWMRMREYLSLSTCSSSVSPHVSFACSLPAPVSLHFTSPTLPLVLS